jgi:cysteine synthase
MNFYNDISEIIGNTPLLKLGRFSPNADVYAKCEFLNPLSVKDRPVLQIILEAEKNGLLKKGDTIIEVTSGNTGMALASIGGVKGYKVVIVMSEIQSLERRQVLSALGAQLILTPAEQGTNGARIKLKKLLKENPEYFYLGQHVNMANPQSHFENTGPEIWKDTDGKIDILISPLGTGGTICGAGKFLKLQNDSIELIAVEPEESPFISQGIFKPHKMMGTAPGFVPETLDREIIDEIFLVSVDDAFEGCRELAKVEGILVGISSGAVAKAALEIAQRPENKNKVIVVTFADSGQRYLSVEGLFTS